MRKYASTLLKSTIGGKFPLDRNNIVTCNDIVTYDATEIPIQTMWGAETHSFSNLVHFVYFSEFLMHDQ